MMTLGGSLYIATSAVVGSAQIVDALLLARRKGEVSRSLLYFSLLEYAWAGVSGVALLQPHDIPPWLPLSFIAYVVALYLTARFFVAPTHNARGAVVVPPTYIILGGLFGLYFVGASLWLLFVAQPMVQAAGHA